MAANEINIDLSKVIKRLVLIKSLIALEEEKVDYRNNKKSSCCRCNFINSYELNNCI